MPTNNDVNYIDMNRFNVYYDDVDLGLTQNAGTRIMVNGEYRDVDNVEQIRGIVASFLLGTPISVETIFERADVSFIRSKIASGQFDTAISGSKQRMFFGTKKRNITQSHTAVLRFHPADDAITDRAGDWYFHKAAARIENWEFVGDNTTEQTLSITWTIYPDLSQLDGQQYGSFGDWSISSSTPLGTFFAMNSQVYEPGMHLDACDIKVSQTDKLQEFAFYGDSTTNAVTAAINNGAGYTAASTSFVFDTLSSARAIVAGDYIYVVTASGNEICYISSVTYTSDTAGTLVVIRSVVGTDDVNDTIADDAVITLIQDTGYENVTLAVTTVTNGTPATATFGYTYGDSDTADQPGVIVGVAAGTTDLDFTYGGVQSPTLTVTVV